MNSLPSPPPAPDPVGLAKAAIGAGFLPVRARWSPGATHGLEAHALGFVVRVEGVWTTADLARFRHFLQLHELAPTEEELFDSLARARRDYLDGRHRLFVCDAHPCCKERHFQTGQADLAAASHMAGLRISMTGCQGHCKHAPVSILRIGDQSQMLAGATEVGDWLAMLSYAKSAVGADSLLVSPGAAGEFLCDPVHESGKAESRLKPLKFLLGHFRGVGRSAEGGYMFQKETLGTLEAGGRFIALRMSATYPLSDGRKDTHRALVIVGENQSSGGITGRAYTDGGGIQEYEVERHGETLVFADSMPDHNRKWTGARKLLKRTDEGFEERLEADAGGGFSTYYSIDMKRSPSS